MLLSGYNKLPVKTMYWTNEPDVFNVMVSENMRRDTFKNCLACIHFSNNLEESQDKFRKVRPLFTNLNSCSLMYMPQSKHLSVDETMIPYYGNNSAKQYIRGKPVRWAWEWVEIALEITLSCADLASNCGVCVRVTGPWCGQSRTVDLPRTSPRFWAAK